MKSKYRRLDKSRAPSPGHIFLVFNSVMRYMPILHNGLRADQSLQNDTCHLVCSMISSSCILTHDTDH